MFTNVPPYRRDKLSSQPSVLMRQAIHDVKLAARTKGFQLDVEHTFFQKEPGDDGKPICVVCVGGATAACRIPSIRKLVSDKTLSHANYDSFFDSLSEGDTGKIYAIDHFRSGNVYDGLAEMHKVLPANSKWRKKIDEVLACHTFDGLHVSDVTQHRKDPKQFFKDMNRVIKSLERLGL